MSARTTAPANSPPGNRAPDSGAPDNSAAGIVVTGVGVALPGARNVPEVRAPRAGDPVDPAARIGRKGLRFKDRATQLGLVAAYEALRDGGLLADPDDPKSPVAVAPATVGVVAGTNYGNLDSVVDTVDTIARDGGTRLVSPITTPNLSSNVIASEVAIRFALRGPNLTVCNGPTSGLDVLRWAATLLRAGRARHVLVLTAEPDNDVVRAFARVPSGVDGAVALLVEPAGVAAARGRPGYATLGGHRRAATPAAVVAGLGVDPAGLAGWYAPEAPADPGPLPPDARLELAGAWGDRSSVHGLLQCADAVARFAAGAAGPLLALCGGADDDATAGVLLAPAPAPAPPSLERTPT